MYIASVLYLEDNNVIAKSFYKYLVKAHLNTFEQQRKPALYKSTFNWK